MGRIIKNGIIYSDSTVAIQPVIYSEEEREIGVWADGKPVYEKTLYSAGGVQGNFNITHNISNIDRVISYSGTVKDTDPQWAAIWTIPRIASDGNNLGINYTNDTVINIINPNAFGTRLVDWYITIQYTKTTDQAGSGQWTPQGVPAVHYSTNEKVVGTWVDSQPIYEKTFVTNIASGNTYVDISFASIANFQCILELTGLLDGHVPFTLNGFVSGATKPVIRSLSYYADYGYIQDSGVRVQRDSAQAYSTSPEVVVTIRYLKSST